MLSVLMENIPLSLQESPRWVLWRNTPRKKGNGEISWAKIPSRVDGMPAKSNDPTTWSTFDVISTTLQNTKSDGIGFVLGDEIHGIDLDDCRDPVTGALSALAKEVLDRVDGYAEISPSGTGIKIFCKTNLNRNQVNHNIGVELYNSGRYFTVTGHVLDGHTDINKQLQNLDWLAEKVQPNKTASSNATSIASFAEIQPPLLEWDLERVSKEILEYIDADCGYQDWLNVGLALHHQGGGDLKWLEIWDEWSFNSAKWVEGDCLKKWQSFKKGVKPGQTSITLRSLIKLTAAARHKVNQDVGTKQAAEIIKLIKGCSRGVEIEQKIAPLISQNPNLSDIERSEIVTCIDSRLKELGQKMAIGIIRKWVAKDSASIVKQEVPRWAQSWVYITDIDKFFDTITKEEVTPQGFRAKFNRFMPFDINGKRLNAIEHALEMWGIPTVSHKGYMPSMGTIFNVFDMQWVNIYRPESVPVATEIASLRDIEAIAIIKKHFELYLPDERERELLISFIAHNVQNPGVKIRWAPYIHGVEGDGKSFFADLLATAMGGINVRSLNGSTLESNFTDWIVGYAVIAIEEMKQHGHSRYDIMNKLKPLITNSVIEVHPKGKTAYMAMNVANFIIFSNYLDGAPIGDTDRRYMFLSSSITKEAAINLNESGHYRNLFDALANAAGAIRSWLLGYQLHPEFLANGRAPETAVKKTVIEISKSEIEIMAEELITTGQQGISKDVISSVHLTRAIHLNQLTAPATTRVNRLIASMGYRFYKRMRWNGTISTVWVRSELNPSEEAAIALLNKTLINEVEILQ